MTTRPSGSSHEAPGDGLLHALAGGTAGQTGEAFFRALVVNVARAVNVAGAWVTELSADERHLRALAFYLGDDYVENYEYEVAGTPCEQVTGEPRDLLIPDRVVELFPHDPDLEALGAVSYASVPLVTEDEEVVGNLAVLDTEPMEEQPRSLEVLRVFANRATAELLRLRVEKELRGREEKLTSLVDGAMDAILELDSDLRVNRVNPAAEKLFGRPATRLVGGGLERLFTPEGRARLRTLVDELDQRPEHRRYLWVAGGLEARRSRGDPVPAEATLSLFEAAGSVHYTLILRNVNDRLTAEATIERLRSRTAMLRDEITELRGGGRILGRSDRMRRTIRQVRRVAPTDATVLLTGESGTGKELFARAIHETSRRAEGPLVRVNCAAVPTDLVESEFFGHEEGAFTGATRTREGRFDLADGGTILLDEVGELPLELQPKLLRALEEGEFEPVGSSETRRVDVRVIGATNRDLESAVRGGRFREDLYYRLAVFPVELPPLRERGDDVVLLARAFADEFAGRYGRPSPTLDADDRRALRSYRWPGNVRELRNVIERAVITARDDRLDVTRYLPSAGRGQDEDGADSTPETPPRSDPAGRGAPGDRVRILRDEELRRLERENLVRALEVSGWTVAGDDGAAARLGIPPSTLRSRIKSFGIERPAP